LFSRTDSRALSSGNRNGRNPRPTGDASTALSAGNASTALSTGKVGVEVALRLPIWRPTSPTEGSLPTAPIAGNGKAALLDSSSGKKGHGCKAAAKGEGPPPPPPPKSTTKPLAANDDDDDNDDDEYDNDEDDDDPCRGPKSPATPAPLPRTFGRAALALRALSGESG
jgi:hypothetical protein